MERKKPKPRRRTWCCSFTTPPSSPDHRPIKSKSQIHRNKSETQSKEKTTTLSLPNSPHTSKSGFPIVSRIDPRRILSPGRVSPIDNIASVATLDSTRSNSFRAPTQPPRPPPPPPECLISRFDEGFDVRLNLRGKKGGNMVLELSSSVLSANSEVFAGLISDYKKGLGLGEESLTERGSKKMCRMEVPEVENLNVYRDTIELMFEDNDHNVTKRLINIGVFRSIDILEVSAGIKFTKGVLACLKYLEAVPWTEEEEEKLRSLFTRFKFDDATTRDILGRLYLHDSAEDSQLNVARQLVWSISACEDANARNELKSLVKGLLCKSSVYEKNNLDLNKEDLYSVCHSCLSSLISLFEEAFDTMPPERLMKKDTCKPLIERISRQVDNINWLLEIMLDGQVAEDFVDIWTDQQQLLKMHDNASPMIRYELSRVSAMLFIAMGTRKLQCRLQSRSGMLQAWFRPMLLDFGWLQRCRKGLDMKTLEEAMGQTLLTLPLNQQYALFMEWFQYFSKHGTECPNLSRAFQIWWRRSFLRDSEAYDIESR
ncbi:hypothetical protein Lal_00049754 [Lupinus albus]|uniref:At3g05675-like ankyrin-like domain-containing protein n=1 Tax=Lupinus albus TaxID=3870 RepID=A0A6A4PMI5_LUPAL|nr:hypothetical protein Lalb_Chr12g0203151 [Lupinus albus]KAF1867325.1 hypothetical protein Lal_00049754 [Lupinus albus]